MPLLRWSNPGHDTRRASSLVRGAGSRELNSRLRRREKNVLDIPFYRAGRLNAQNHLRVSDLAHPHGTPLAVCHVDTRTTAQRIAPDPPRIPQDALGRPEVARGYSPYIRPATRLRIAGNGLLGAGSAVGWPNPWLQILRGYTDHAGHSETCNWGVSGRMEHQNAQNWGSPLGECLASACKYRAV